MNAEVKTAIERRLSEAQEEYELMQQQAATLQRDATLASSRRDTLREEIKSLNAFLEAK